MRSSMATSVHISKAKTCATTTTSSSKSSPIIRLTAKVSRKHLLRRRRHLMKSVSPRVDALFRECLPVLRLALAAFRVHMMHITCGCILHFSYAAEASAKPHTNIGSGFSHSRTGQFTTRTPGNSPLEHRTIFHSSTGQFSTRAPGNSPLEHRVILHSSTG